MLSFPYPVILSPVAAFLRDRHRIVTTVVVVRFSLPIDDLAGPRDGGFTRSQFRARDSSEMRLCSFRNGEFSRISR